VTYQGHTRIDGTSYNLSTGDLVWQPAEIITQRVVYTLSENFPEPSYMPMAWDHNQQYYDEDWSRVSGNYVDGDAGYPTDSWVLDAHSSSDIQKWLNANSTKTLPTKWTADWVNTNWPAGKFFGVEPVNGIPTKFIAYDTLRNEAWSQVETDYDAKYSYTAIHDPDGDGIMGNLDTPSKYNIVSSKHIYNTAIVTPYDTSPSVLENWIPAAARVINGAFIQLPTTTKLYTSTTAPTYNRINNPATNTFNYESRFGKGSAASNTPHVGLTFGADSSWREIPITSF
jgi:hypothetical protein